jgi:uncharacterized protein YndB with AHSA1/START domain
MANIHHLLLIDAPIEKIYQAISTVEGYKNWWTEETSGDFKVGGEVHFNFGEQYKNMFEVAYLDENARVVLKGKMCAPDWMNSKIDIRLDEHDGLVRVRFAHLDYPDDNDFYAQCNYTWGYFLRSLKDYCEKGKGFPSKK